MSPAQAHDWLVQLQDSDWIKWQRETFNIFGRQVDAPRTILVGDAGLNYRYTGVDHCAFDWPEPLQGLKDGWNWLLVNRLIFSYSIDTQMDLNTWDGIGMMVKDVVMTSSPSLGASRRFNVIGRLPSSKRMGRR